MYNPSQNTNDVQCILVLNNKLYSGSFDNTIRVWNTETNECETVLKGHTNWVQCLLVHNNKLYSGSQDKTIRVWKL